MQKTKLLLLSLCMVLLVTASVLGTLAYLTSQDTVINTFTVGNVNITLDEAAVNPDGTAKDSNERVKTNNYHLVPGRTYIKDPTMTIIKGSEESFVRILVTFNCLKELDAAFAPIGADFISIFNGYDAEQWTYQAVQRDKTANTVTYEFRYKEAVKPSDNEDLTLDALFDSITIPGTFDNDDMASVSNLEITVTGHAIQAAGFTDENQAWSSFAEQING